MQPCHLWPEAMPMKCPVRTFAPLVHTLQRVPGTSQASGKPRIIAKISNAGNVLAFQVRAAHEALSGLVAPCG